MNSDVLPSQDRDDNSPETASTSSQISSHPRPPKRRSDRSTLSSLPRIEQECNDSSTPSKQYNSDSLHSTEHTEVQLSIPEQSAGAFKSNFNDCQ
ncbi:unnamed protein product [Acanthoscelides obtectus]|uniref:Uncharacterized protein n=1 Tax=Acanthoscelides obtectus TaxID=200917 RepID=A0A9P0PFN1_ACAOB|nr:unnamed protein product [Acanthoscelides obtectus]CAK1635858.1 hypothetical protein AOBTE_LOCUS9568 [Acanthoscelides obtectus]